MKVLLKGANLLPHEEEFSRCIWSRRAQEISTNVNGTLSYAAANAQGDMGYNQKSFIILKLISKYKLVICGMLKI